MKDIHCFLAYALVLLPQRFAQFLKQPIKIIFFLLINFYLVHAWTQPIRPALSPARPQNKVIVMERDG
jgi:hypothetical protein